MVCPWSNRYFRDFGSQLFNTGDMVTLCFRSSQPLIRFWIFVASSKVGCVLRFSRFLHLIYRLFFTGSLNRRKMWNLVKTLFFCRFYPIGLFSFPSLCIESFADGFLPMRISSFLFYLCILCTRHMMAYNSWIWTSTWWANFSSWLVSFLNICASVVSFNLHFFCICAVHHWFCTHPVRLSVCVCVRVSVCALAFVHHL